MLIDQKWVIENFHIIDKIFTRLNKSDQNLDRERKNMKTNMDKLKYRAYYELARKQEKEKVNKAKTIGDKQERLRMDEIIECNASNTKYAIDLLEEQLDEKQNELDIKNKQIEAKDKQIESLLEILNQKLSLSVSE